MSVGGGRDTGRKVSREVMVKVWSVLCCAFGVEKVALR